MTQEELDYIGICIETAGGIHEWDAQRTIVELYQEVKRLRAVLARYADHDNWFGSSADGCELCSKDNDVWLGKGGNGWEVAEAALEGKEGE